MIVEGLMHGTPRIFGAFDPSMIGSTTSGAEEDETGFFLTRRRRTAMRYATGPDGRIVHATIRPRNPIVVTGAQWGAGEGPSPREAADAGHDCYVVRPYEDGPMWLVLDPGIIDVISIETVRP
jgi:hypothetical protein